MPLLSPDDCYMKSASYLLCLVSLSGCATASEVLFEGSSTADYQRTTDSQGHTKYVRHRIVSDYEIARPSLSLDSSPLSETAPAPPLIDVDKMVATELSTDRSTLSSIVATASANDNTANLDLSYEWLGEYISGGVGIAFVGSDRSYFGFTGQARAHFPWTVTPYLGLGFYGGDSKTCTYEPLGGGYSEEICEKYLLYALTGDLGLQIKVSEPVRIRLFARGFTQTRQGDPLGATLYGIGTVIAF